MGTSKSTRIALLRAVNVGGRNSLAMSDLRKMVAALGFRDARTLLQSGNLIFRGARQSDDALERLLEAECQKRLKLSIDFVIRTLDEWQAMIDANPLARKAANDPSHLVVMVLKSTPGKNELKALKASIRGREVVKAKGKQLYISYPDGIGTSKLTGTLIERVLGVRGTARNWNTVLKLAELARGEAED